MLLKLALVVAIPAALYALLCSFVRCILVANATLPTVTLLNRIAAAFRQHRAAPLEPLFLRGHCPTPSLSDEDCPSPVGQVASPLLGGVPVSRHGFSLSFILQVVERMPSVSPCVPLEERSHAHHSSANHLFPSLSTFQEKSRLPKALPTLCMVTADLALAQCLFAGGELE